MARIMIRSHTLANGLVIVSEAVPDVRAVSFQIMVPAGTVTESRDHEGISSLIENCCYRGAGTRDARQLSDTLDELGVQRGGGADLETTTFAGTLLADDLEEALRIYADIIRRPTFPGDQLEGARQLALQRLESIKDNPTQRLFIELAKVYFADPFGRSTLGTPEGINAVTVPLLRSDHHRRYAPRGAIVAVAGRFDWDRVVGMVEDLFGDWTGEPVPLPLPDFTGRQRYSHLPEESSQEQIGVAWPEVTVDHPRFYESRMAIQVLSGGMSARLDTEIREKRGLVYNVAAFPRSVKGASVILAYAGTTPERRQECLDVLLAELRRLPEGITTQELERARIGLLSSLVMQGESCSSRAATIARDQFMLGRVRTLDEVRSAVEQVTTASMTEHLRAHPPGDFTIVTLGPEAVEVAG